MQYLEEDLSAQLLGKAVTISILLSDGIIKTATATIPSILTTWQEAVKISEANWQTTLQWTNTNKLQFFVRAYANESVSFKAVKLELGTVSTLSLDTSPNYVTELLKCQRYFYRLKIQRYVTSVLGQSYENDKVQIPFNLSVEPRTNPSVSLSSNTLFVRKGTSSLTVTSIRTRYLNSGILTAEFDVSGAEAGGVYGLYTNVEGGGYIDFSADL